MSSRFRKRVLIGILIFLLLLVLLVFFFKRRSAAKFIAIKDPVIALRHIRVIDGTGSAPREDQTIVIESGRISAIGPTAQITIPASANSLDLTGHTASALVQSMGGRAEKRDGV